MVSYFEYFYTDFMVADNLCICYESYEVVQLRIFVVADKYQKLTALWVSY